ncbi:MAG: endolytic transglycosylase MltG [Synergistaceae bacterium]|nr:endolytic transglycosylase MltG [Synergistaceae bacterium]
MKRLEVLIYAAALFFLFALCRYIPQTYPQLYRLELKPVPVNVRRGCSTQLLVHTLKQKDVILFEKTMRVWLALSGSDKTIQPGMCRIVPGSIFTVACQLKNARPEFCDVSIIPGKTPAEITESNGLSLEKLKNALADAGNFPEKLRPLLPKEVLARSVFLLPERYFLIPNEKIEQQLVAFASKLWFEKVGKSIPAEKFNAKYLLETGIMASIVEGEARVKEDRKPLAEIFLKRLKTPMRLQSCATVIYCWKEFKGVKKSRLTYSDLHIESPYNTYRKDGLPPGPINVPSANCWLAVCSAGDTEYLYFVADGSGRHLFSKSYSEHLKKQRGLKR